MRQFDEIEVASVFDSLLYAELQQKALELILLREPLRRPPKEKVAEK